MAASNYFGTLWPRVRERGRSTRYRPDGKRADFFCRWVAGASLRQNPKQVLPSAAEHPVAKKERRAGGCFLGLPIARPLEAFDFERPIPIVGTKI
jgi:hypothetical protein